MDSLPPNQHRHGDHISSAHEDAEQIISHVIREQAGERPPSLDHEASQNDPLMNKFTMSTQQHQFPDSSDPDTEEKRPRKIVGQLNLWTWEILSLILSICVIAAVVAILAVYDTKTLPEWPHSLTLNTVLSIFSTILKALLFFVVTEGLSQAKWLWFRDPRPLSHIGRFDESSRGVLGALKFLWFLRFQDLLALLGIVIILISLALDPFLQQAVQYQYCPWNETNPSLKASIPFARYFSPWDMAVADIVPLSFRSAVLEGFLTPNTNNTATVFSCPTGNCTFPTYSSLATCFSCENAVYDLEHQCNSGTGCRSSFSSGDGPTVILGDGPEFWTVFSSGHVGELTNFSQTYMPFISMGIVYYTSGSCTEDWLSGGHRQETDCISSSKAYGSDNVTNLIIGNFTPPNIAASFCSVAWCVRDYSSNVSSNFFSEESSMNQAQRTQTPSLRKKFDWDLAFIADPCYVNGTKYSLDQILLKDTNNDPNYVLVSSNSTASNQSVLGNCLFRPDGDLYSASIDWLTGTGSIVDNADPIEGYGNLSIITKGLNFLNDTHHAEFSPVWMEQFYDSGNANFSTINTAIANLVDTLNNHVRGTGNDSVVGMIQTNQSCVKVSWAWLALPIALTALTCIFLAAVMIQSKRLGFDCTWKSSPFALTLLNLREDTRADIGESLSNDSVYEKTNLVTMHLKEDAHGIRLKQE